jgi:hypothetical protein
VNRTQQVKATAMLKQAVYLISAFAKEMPEATEVAPVPMAKQAEVIQVEAPEGMPVTSGGFYVNVNELREIVNALGPA